MKIRPFDYTDGDYSTRLALERLVTPEERPTMDWTRRADREFEEENANTVVRLVGELDGQMIASGKYWHAIHANDRQLQFDFVVHPAHQAGPFPQQMHDTILDQIADKSPETISSEVRENELYRVQLLEASGLNLVMRFPCSQQDVTAFDPSPYDAARSQLLMEGIDFVTLTDMMTNDPDWKHNVWRMFITIEQDVPLPDPIGSTPFEEYAAYYSAEDFQPDSWQIAIDMQKSGVERYVGMSVVNRMPTRPDTLYEGIIGVTPRYRRRKIATVLKVCSTLYAREKGFRYIYTDNEEANPMLLLNLSLGFKLQPAWLYYKKKVRQ